MPTVPKSLNRQLYQSPLADIEHWDASAIL